MIYRYTFFHIRHSSKRLIKWNTIPDFIYHLPERGNELSILGRDFAKQTLGLHIPEDELKLHPYGIHHPVETIPLPRGNSTPVRTDWYPLNMREYPRFSGKETSFGLSM